MKTSIPYLSLLAVLFFSCGQQKENTDYAEFDYDSETYYEENRNENQNYQTAKTNTSNYNKLKGYKVMSKKFGMPLGTMPIPSTWNKSNKAKEGVLFESNDGVKVYGERFKSHFYSNNQQQNYYAKQGGSIIQPPKTINRVIQEDLKPYLESQGLRLVNQFPIPQLAQFDKRFDSYLFKSSPENKQYQCIATEWEDKNGGKSIGIIRYFTNQYTTIGGMDWGYTFNSMEAPKDNYEQAKKALINALVNFQINPKWVQANNRHYSNLSQQSNAGHQQRMAAINAQGQAIRNNGKTYSSITDSNHESWKRRNGITDAGHSNSINSGVWERSTVSNPNTGQTYQVEGQNSYYYGNNNNEYIGTNDALYNPNIDNSMNDQEWTQYNIEN
ncbi:hypothetical protein [uncultured Algibacter sp.]|uniref:hypothetical protein n=1 Tax=uncultured Algibacter sp. TaxID=298659 RepID=UPI0030ED77C0|tara:strand:+ start:2569 stop:3723 length:1155 start_codon:yes stop_codon:yes gene_type:complete